MENLPAPPQELLDELKKLLTDIRSVQDQHQGQMQALRVALAAFFAFAQAEERLRDRVESALDERLRLMEKGKEPAATVRGFESMQQEIVSAFHLGNQADTAH